MEHVSNCYAIYNIYCYIIGINIIIIKGYQFKNNMIINLYIFPKITENWIQLEFVS